MLLAHILTEILLVGFLLIGLGAIVNVIYGKIWDYRNDTAIFKAVEEARRDFV